MPQEHDASNSKTGRWIALGLVLLVLAIGGVVGAWHVHLKSLWENAGFFNSKMDPASPAAVAALFHDGFLSVIAPLDPDQIRELDPDRYGTALLLVQDNAEGRHLEFKGLRFHPDGGLALEIGNDDEVMLLPLERQGLSLLLGHGRIVRD